MLKGLVHGPGRRVVGGQEPGRSDQDVPARLGPPALLVLLKGRVDDLEVVEGGVLPQHGVGEDGQEAVRAWKGSDVVGHDACGLFDLPLRVHRLQQPRAQVLRGPCAVWLGNALGRHVQEAVKVDAYRRIKHGTQELDRRGALKRLV